MSQLLGFIIMFFLHTNFDHSELVISHASSVNDEVIIKSILSDDQKTLHLQVTIPESSNVGIKLYNSQDRIIHLWNDQRLNNGTHQLKLNIPELSTDRYSLHVHVGSEVYRQLLIIH